jgi:hypothetical protein
MSARLARNTEPQPKRRPSGIGLPSGRERARDEFYLEPRWLINALLDVEWFDGSVLDPFCGGGNIVGACLQRGIAATGSDLWDRGFGERRDAFNITEPVVNVLSNPPFRDIEWVIEHFLPLVRHKLVLLARLNILEGLARNALYRESPPARVWVSSRRASIPPGHLAHPRDEFGAMNPLPATGGSTAYAFIVWDREYTGPTVLGWIPREVAPPRTSRRSARPQQASPATSMPTLLPPEPPVRKTSPDRGVAIANRVLRIAAGKRVDAQDSKGVRWSGTAIALLRDVGIFDQAPAPKGQAAATPVVFSPEQIDGMTLPAANGRLTAVAVWQRVVPATVRERLTLITGALPGGQRITLQTPIYAALAWAAGPDGELVVDAQRDRVFARSAAGQIVGVGAVTRGRG